MDIELFSEILKIDSTSGKEAALADFLQERLLGNLALQYVDSLLLVLTTASIDEYSQTFSVGRAAQPTDVLIDLLGAFLCCSFILLIVCKLRSKHKKSH